MDIFDFDNVKVEKANAMLRYRRLQHLTKLFRLGEVCLALVLLTWISSRIPFVVKITGEYFRLLLSIIVTPLFIFLLCNVIVLTLLAKSGQLSGQSQDVNNADTELYEELLTKTEQMINLASGSSPSIPEPEDIVYQDKQMIFESNTKSRQNCEENQAKFSVKSIPDQKVFQRSQSEHLKAECLEPEKQFGKLRRSETDICRKVETPAKAMDDVVDELSNEEFQRRIEGFIAKQVKFHQEEKLAIVLHSS